MSKPACLRRVAVVAALFCVGSLSGSCCRAWEYVDRSVACPELAPAGLSAALEQLTDWQVTPAPPAGPGRSWAFEQIYRGKPLVDVFCSRGQRTIHVALYGGEGGPSLVLFTEWGSDIRGDMRALYEALRARCEALPAWETMVEYAQVPVPASVAARDTYLKVLLAQQIMACGFVVALYFTRRLERAQQRVG